MDLELFLFFESLETKVITNVGAVPKQLFESLPSQLISKTKQPITLL